MFRFALAAARRIAAASLAALSFATPAATMSDLWWNPSESGWGANVIEQQGTLFITLFVYGPDQQPTWYVGPATTQVASSSGRTFTGPLYATTGPWLASFFNPGAVGVRQVGSVTFAASSPVFATLSYSVDGVSVTKSVQRQTWKHINLSGTYYGATDVLSSSSCSVPSSLAQPGFTTHALTATVSSSGLTGTLTMTISDLSGSMSFTGDYRQYGALFEVTGTLFVGGIGYTANVRDFTADDDGIRGNLNALAATGCVLNFRFAAVRPG